MSRITRLLEQSSQAQARQADALEGAAEVWDTIAALPAMRALRRAGQAAKLAPKFDVNRPALTPYARELLRLANTKPTRWEPPEII